MSQKWANAYDYGYDVWHEHGWTKGMRVTEEHEMEEPHMMSWYMTARSYMYHLECLESDSSWRLK